MNPTIWAGSRLFADDPLSLALAGAPLDGSITRAVELRPCSGGSRPCPPFGKARGAFNLLRPLPKQADSRRLPNPENHQPPLFDLAAGLLLRASTRLDPSGWLSTPDVRLLWARLVSVGLVGLAILFPLRALFRSRERSVAAAGLLLLLLPGALGGPRPMLQRRGGLLLDRLPAPSPLSPGPALEDLFSPRLRSPPQADGAARRARSRSLCSGNRAGGMACWAER